MIAVKRSANLLPDLSSYAGEELKGLIPQGKSDLDESLWYIADLW